MKAKESFIEIVCYLFIFLFLYTAASKLAEHDLFLQVLTKMPYVSYFAGFISWLVPVLEIVISIMLIIPRTKILGLKAAMILMLIFTVYLTAMILLGIWQVCQCGGILESMTWNQHILFNTFFILIAIAALEIHRMGLAREKLNTIINHCSNKLIT